MPAEAGSAVPFSQTISPIPLALAGSSFPLGILCWVTSWGDVRQDVSCSGPARARRLQEVDVHIVSPKSCCRLSRPEPVAKEMLCAGHFQGQKGFCEGDSGGPLVCPLRDQRWVRVAVVSFSGGCAEPAAQACAPVSACQPWIRATSSCRDTCAGADPSPGHGLPFSRHLF